MESLAVTLIGVAALLVGYAYVGYPALLGTLGRRGPSGSSRPEEPAQWPEVSLTVPAYNEASQMKEVLEHLLQLDYPRERLQILVVSDASTDGTDRIVRSFADRGVELHRMTVRRGKTAAENAVAPLLRGRIVVNTDASIRIHPRAIKALVRRLEDPTVGLASGRDISVSPGEAAESPGESRYVGYEMWVRALETRTSGIVGASGCLYAIRSELHRQPLPDDLSRDFAAALITREHGLRAVSVDEATCLVPRTRSLRKEYHRKVRTMTRGMRTLLYKRSLLNPLRHGPFAWKLFSHKVCRWLIPWAGVAAAVGLLLLAPGYPAARAGVAALGLLAAAAAAGWIWPVDRRMPAAIAVPAHLVWSNVAALHAALRVPLGGGSAVWEPTRRQRGERSSPATG